MGNTANNNWPYPESTDLVKDGATAIENLADAIDTTLGVFVPSNPGLTLINTTSFSGVASISLPTGTFTSTYDNYKIILDMKADSSNNDTFMRVRASGTDLTTSTYKYGRIFVGVFAGVPLGSENEITSTQINIGSTVTTAGAGGNQHIEIQSPMLATRTNIKSIGVGNAVHLGGAVVNNTTAYDSITIFMSGQNITGTIRAYGYQN
jgi:hypothetical protein